MLHFPKKGTFEMKGINIYALPMENYKKQVELLRTECLEDIEWSNNHLSGTIDLSKDKILCMSIPYSNGWTATVDGEKTKILRGNYMFMALPLTMGSHVINLYYCPPGLKAGIIVSLVCWCIMVGIFIHDRKKSILER